MDCYIRMHQFDEAVIHGFGGDRIIEGNAVNTQAVETDGKNVIGKLM